MSLNPIPLSECQPGGSVLNPLLQRFHRLSVSRGQGASTTSWRFSQGPNHFGSTVCLGGSVG